MTPWQNRVTDVTRRMADDMKLRNYSQKTIDAYTYHVGRFAEFLGKCPLEATAEDVRSFQLHMIEVRKIGWSSFNADFRKRFADDKTDIQNCKKPVNSVFLPPKMS
jgi:hypothetical protein